jgi:hypothetical protein
MGAFMENARNPTVTLTPDESRTLRDLVQLRGLKDATRSVGLADWRALAKAAAGFPVARLTAEVIRGRLDRI